MNDYQRLKQCFQDQTLPLAFVDLDALEQNANSVLKRSGNLPVRIASKSIRCTWMLTHLLEFSAQFQGLMCFSASEALWLSQQGFDNLLLGYPSYEQAALEGLCQQVKSGKQIYFMLDCSEQARLLNHIAQHQGVSLLVCLDLDMSSHWPGLHFGVKRSPLTALKPVQDLCFALENFKQLHIKGLMGYEAQIAGVGDQLPGQKLKNTVIQALQKKSQSDVFARRQQVVNFLRQNYSLDFVNGGGTGSLELTAQDSSVTELTAGSAFYAPALFDYYRRFDLVPAAGFAQPIVRQPAAGMYTCLGGGYIASGSVGTEKQPVIWQPTGAELTALEGAGEVQTPIRYQGSKHLSLGDPVFFRHAKAGELCERFNQLYLIRQGHVLEEVKTYRGQGQCFL